MDIVWQPSVVAFLGWQEILLIMVIVVLLFGASRLPALARSLGKAASEFKKGRDEGGKDAGADPEKPGDRHDA